MNKIEYLPTELLADSNDDRNGIVDIRCKDENNDEYIITEVKLLQKV